MQSRVLLLMLPVLLVATAARFYELGNRSLWADELWSVHFASLGWRTMMDNLVNEDTHLPGYRSLLYVWMEWFGSSDIAVRLPSAMAGTMSVWCLYRFAITFFSPFVAIIASALLATSYGEIYYSQEAVPYAFLSWFAIWYLHVFLKISLLHHRSVTVLLEFWLAAILLIYFHYVGLVAVVGSAVILSIMQPLNLSLLRQLAILYVPLAVAYLPWLPVMYKHWQITDPSFLTPVPRLQQLIETARFWWGPDNLRLCAGLLLFAVFWREYVRAAKHHALARYQRVAGWMLLYAILPWLVFFVKSHIGLSIYTVRHFIYMIPFLCVITACSLEYIVSYFHPPVSSHTLSIILAAIIGLSLYLDSTGQLKYGGKLYSQVKIEYRDAVQLVANDSDVVKATPHIFTSNLFFDHYLRQFGLGNAAEQQWQENAPEKTGEYADYIARQQIASFYYLEVVPDPSKTAPSLLMQQLWQRYHPVCRTRFVWVEVVRFSVADTTAANHMLPRCPYAEETASTH